MTTAVTIPNPMTQESIVVLQPETLAQVDGLIVLAHACNPVDAETLEAANVVFADIDALGKQIAEARLEITRPLDDLKKQIMAAEKQATEPLATAKTELGQRLVTCQRRLDAERKEAERKAREEAERKAAEERARLEAERQAEIERRAAEEAMFGDDDTSEPEPLPPVREVLPEVIPQQVAPAPRAAATTATRKVMQIVDEAAIIAEACKHGGCIHGRPVLTVNTKAVEALLKAGCPVPGAELQEVMSIRAAGRR